MKHFIMNESYPGTQQINAITTPHGRGHDRGHDRDRGRGRGWEPRRHPPSPQSDPTVLKLRLDN